jgi:hexosaminidase
MRLVKHKALNAKVNYNVAYSDKYAAGGAVALTDGLRGGWANNDGRWQGFIGAGGVDVTIDLGSTQRIRRVATNFMQACGPEIFYPSSYVVSVSTDGKNFTEVGRKERASEKTTHPDVELWQWQGSAKARYVKVQAAPSTFGGWLFADEIEVY